ncbi:MAG: von Willebrand factor type A domain-containing protein [Microgenomates group bacterium]
MTNDLDALKAALRVTPAPNAAVKDAALKLAMENFDRLQGSTTAPRPNPEDPQKAGLWNRIYAMLNALRTKPALAASTSVAALCLGLVVMMPLTQTQTVTTVTPPTDAVVSDAILMKPSPTIAPIPEASGAATARSATEFAEADNSRVEALADPESLDTMAEATISVEAPMAASPKMALADAEGSLVSDAAPFGTENSEAFATGPANPVYVTAENPVSTFSIDVDTASYATVRSSLNAGFLPDPTSVRIEEMINYFPYAYPVPQRDAAFHPTVTVMPTPWNANTSLVHVAIQGAMPAIADRPPLNLVFLIDTSGSMDEPNKLPLLVQSLSLLQGQLHEYDQVAIVAYAGSAGQVLAPTKATDQTAIMGALNQLAAGGSTAGAQGLELAYQTAEAMAAPGEVTRVLLATDGDFNVGIDDPEALKTYIAGKRETGIYLSVLGFGRGNLDDATMQALAQNGNGTAAYIDTLSEARKVLVDQLTGALFPIADNVKIQIEWNPAQVAEYRLIGYETRTLRREDFNNDAVDAGDIGAGTAVTAIYEVTAPNSPALRNDPLRYGTAEPAISTPELGFLRLRSVAPGATASTLLETPILTGGQANNDARFAAAIAGFGQLLTGSVYLGDWGWDQAIDLGLAARGADEFGYRIEAVNLMRAAKALNQ